ncbi:hypothetical protein TNCV_4876361 [Trichonephila clavipes]|uniref:Uncharacterized protein n=1 Tax=Trichonephila clavipes TaxID=2585209 RepID=A0A8X6RHS1_TRICX|nr:hypothetical protein TNCV_4876361 [Trichonephila clavipes]
MNVFEQCNARQLFRVSPKVTGKPKVLYDYKTEFLCSSDRSLGTNFKRGLSPSCSIPDRGLSPTPVCSASPNHSIPERGLASPKLQYT